MIARALAADGDVALFAHGHILRDPRRALDRAAARARRELRARHRVVCELGFERETRVLERWNT